MKRGVFFFVVLCILMNSRSSFAAYRFQSPAYAGVYGDEASIIFDSSYGTSSGRLLLLDENGRQLGSARVNKDISFGSIVFTVTKDMPRKQTIQLVMEKQEGNEILDEALLALDYADRAGVRKVETDEKKIAITFDAAYGIGKTEAIMQLLEKYQAESTFFLQGNYMMDHPEMTAEIHRRGHEVGNHTMSHPDMRLATNRDVFREIDQCNQLIISITGQERCFYRPPAGFHTYRDRAIARALGSEMILWTFDSWDGFTVVEEETIWENMLENTEPGAIILMHVYGQHTLTILERYLPLMQEQGYEFVTVSDLLPPNGVIDSEGVMRAPEAAP